MKKLLKFLDSLNFKKSQLIKMVRISIYFFLILFCCFLVSTVNAQMFQQEVPVAYGYIVELGQTVPDFEIELPNGSKTHIRKLRGNVVMLQFTASWCGVCRKEMPHIEKEIWQKHKDNPNFDLYGIDLKEPKETVIDFKEKLAVTYPIALDTSGAIFDKFTVPGAGVTRNVIIDREGKIVFLTRLFKKEEFDKMKEVIDLLLSSPVDEE